MIPNSVRKDVYNFIKYDKTQIIGKTISKSGSSGGYLLPYWKSICDDENNNGKLSNFIKSTKRNSPTIDSGATSLPPIGNAFQYFATGSANSGSDNVFYIRTNRFFRITIKTFYYNRFSIITNGSIKSMGRFKIHLKLEENTWSI